MKKNMLGLHAIVDSTIALHGRWSLLTFLPVLGLIMIVFYSGYLIAEEHAAEGNSDFEQGNFLYVQELYELAMDAYESYLARGPEMPHRGLVTYLLGKCHEHRGSTEKAIEFYRKVETIDPTGPWIDDSWLALATLKINSTSGKFVEEGISLFHRCIEHSSDMSCVLKARFGLGQAYFKRGEWKNCESAFLLILDSTPSDRLAIETLFALGDFYRTSHNPLYNIQQAIATYRRIIDLYPKNAPLNSVYLALGNTYREAKQCEQAISCYNKVIGDYPDSLQAPLAQSMIGLCYEESDKLAESFNAYQQVKKFNAPQILQETISSRSTKLKRINKKAIHIEADTINYQAAVSKARYEGNVSIFWEDCIITAKNTTAMLQKSLFLIEGDVVCLNRQDLKLTAFQAHLFPKEKRIILYGSATITTIEPVSRREQKIVEAKKISYDFSTDMYSVEN